MTLKLIRISHLSNWSMMKMVSILIQIYIHINNDDNCIIIVGELPAYEYEPNNDLFEDRVLDNLPARRRNNHIGEDQDNDDFNDSGSIFFFSIYKNLCVLCSLHFLLSTRSTNGGSKHMSSMREKQCFDRASTMWTCSSM
ncbi:uncharacterized protein [Chelonus insularis]|uniref:uncharacterized protein n=1 Tax=Chelonus insularis TaxID=460826 RepID=UPI0015884E36|nr:uncharacterized protein LOC118071070 [Chelonus insularis]XP_034945917.1 uncharacterized protein LOC118071071 [Chelonus insularis]